MSDGTLQALEAIARAVEIATFLGGLGWGAYWLGQFKQEVSMSIDRLEKGQETLEKNQEALQQVTNKLGDILLAMAEERSRVNVLERRVEELRHGDGFVRPFPWES